MTVEKLLESLHDKLRSGEITADTTVVFEDSVYGPLVIESIGIDDKTEFYDFNTKQLQTRKAVRLQ